MWRRTGRGDVRSIGIGNGGGADYQWAVAGLVYGAMGGAAVGLLVGLLLTFLVGGQLPLDHARHRAFLVAFISTGLILTPTLGLLLGFQPMALASVFVSAMAAGSLSRWVAAIGTPRQTNTR